MKKVTEEQKEEWHKKYLQDIKDTKDRINVLLYNDMWDDDGYPTNYALEIVRIWHWSDSKGWFDFIKSIWWSPDWGWKEQEVIDEISNKKEYCYYISTGGWSGNESIIRHMQENQMMWAMCWVQSRRGGHYIFELKEFKDD